jgi:RNA polymerase sigma factor (sigma-70 family)
MKRFFTEELIETTYLYCYKRLNDSEDAKELAQDILTEAYAAVKTGRRIDSFYSWYWQLAYNRYCLYLKMRSTGAVSLETAGGVIPAETEPFDSIEDDEEISALNYALSRLSKAYRETVVLYYLKELSIKEIAIRLGLPEGTVKSRLHDAKLHVKEGVERMNRIGQLSYAPVDLQLFGGYSAPRYWDSVNDLMTKQIFSVCAKEPKSIREIADEIGVAPVYFEEKMEYLLKNKFIKEKSKGTYVTDFVILPKQAWIEFQYECSCIYESFGKEITEAIRSVEKTIRELPFYGNDMELSYLLWILYVYACTAAGSNMMKIHKESLKEKVPIVYKKIKTVSRSNLHNDFQTSRYRKVTHANLFQIEPFPSRDQIISERNINTVMKLFNNPYAALTDVEQEQAAKLIEKGYLQKKGTGLFLTMPVIEYKIKKEMESIFERVTVDMSKKYVQSVTKLGDRILLPHIREDLFEEYVNFILSISFSSINRVFYYGMYEGKTPAIPEDYNRSAAGICLYYTE